MHKLPDLPYSFNSLEPHIDAQTIQIHHDKHHAGYVAKLNATIEGKKELADMSVEDLLTNIDKVDTDLRQAVLNSGGGHANHSLYWTCMSPSGGGEPDGKLSDAIKSEFGSFEEFKSQFTDKALTLFGSGWVFLSTDNAKLEIKRHSFQNTPLTSGKTPLLALDVWEHAYYLKYRNMRADYITAWWRVINWQQVSRNYS